MSLGFSIIYDGVRKYIHNMLPTHYFFPDVWTTFDKMHVAARENKAGEKGKTYLIMGIIIA